MKSLQAFVIRHLPIVAPAWAIGTIVVLLIGIWVLKSLHTPHWLMWTIGAPYIGGTGFVAMMLSGEGAGINDDDDA